LERLARLDEQREERFAVVGRMRAAFADVPTEDIEREAAKAALMNQTVKISSQLWSSLLRSSRSPRRFRMFCQMPQTI
jgi:hypothetical protein